MVVKKKTSLGTWAIVALVILLSVASGAYQQHQKDQVKREIQEKYNTTQVTPNDIDGCVDGADCYTTK